MLRPPTSRTNFVVPTFFPGKVCAGWRKTNSASLIGIERCCKRSLAWVVKIKSDIKIVTSLRYYRPTKFELSYLMLDMEQKLSFQMLRCFLTSFEDSCA